MLLIITSRDDLTADFLITHLLERKLPYFRLNSEDLADAEYLFSLNGKEVIRRCAVAGKSVNLNDVRAVWYRRMLWPQPSDETFSEDRQFVAGEMRHLIEGLVLDPSILWVNPIDAVAVAERKIFQLRQARDVGLRVPPTLISNDPHELREFAAGQSEGVICKPIYQGLLTAKSDRFAIYTSQVNPEDLHDDGQLKSCATLLQRRIPKAKDLRITFIGKKVFPVEISSSGLQPLDWRRPGERLRYTSFELSSNIERSCRELLRRLRLAFGAFDFAQTPDGEHYFLEVNPTGEWAWLELALGLPMRDAFLGLFFG